MLGKKIISYFAFLCRFQLCGYCGTLIFQYISTRAKLIEGEKNLAC